MGTINYFTSEYVTLGVCPFESVFAMINGECEKDTRDLTPEEFEDIQERVQAVIDQYDFNNTHINIKPGYYEGFSLEILPYEEDYYNLEERNEVIAELKTVEECLLKCLETGLCVCTPGWCTGYYNKTDSIKAVKKAVAQMKEDYEKIKVICTEREAV